MEAAGSQRELFIFWLNIRTITKKTPDHSVYKAVNFDEHRVAACKVIALTDETTEKERKTLDKEIRVHAAMKHTNVLEFLNAAIVENEPNARYVPAIYMLLELASGGDLFDKIGTYNFIKNIDT